MYADDAVLYSSAPYFETAAANLQSDFNALQRALIDCF